MKIAFIYGKKPSSTLTKFFTGSSCYHVGFTNGFHFWDMHLIRRRRQWPHYPLDKVILVDCPVEVSARFLESKLETDESKYGVIDYLLFAMRPIYHLFGKNTKNAGGVICSEMVFNDLVENGFSGTFQEVPSPADLEKMFIGRLDAINANH